MIMYLHMNTFLKSLKNLDIVITIFNQEEIIERVLYGVFRNTTTSFNLILIFDGCTDRTKPRALKYIKKVNPFLLKELIVRDTPNLFELRANNFGFRLAQTNHLITIQDDMIIKEYGWERRLTYPLRKFDDVLAVTARAAQDIEIIGPGKEKYINRSARELNTLNRNIFAIRDVINRGPIAFRIDYLKELNYLNDKYAPGALDDAEISLRAWIEKRLKVGAFWIDYLSKQQWSKVNAPDSTMKAWESWSRNQTRIYEDFKEYLDSKIKHDEDYNINEREVDYIYSYTFLKKFFYFLLYPLRIDKRSLKTSYGIYKRKLVNIFKTPFVITISLFLGKKFIILADEFGIKKAVFDIIKKRKARRS